jgi:hypothetical protein
MNTRKNVALTILALGLATASAAAMADRGYRHHGHGGSRVQFGIMLGAPLFYPAPTYYPYPYPVHVPTFVVPREPPVYIERGDQTPPSASSAGSTAVQTSPFWYYCRDSDTYYPYVKECAQPWERLAARPATR